MPDIVGTIYQLFSDDAKLYRSIILPEDNRKLQDDLDGINEWSVRWQLPFMIDKCKSLHISRKNMRHCNEMEGKELEQVTGYRLRIH